MHGQLEFWWEFGARLRWHAVGQGFEFRELVSLCGVSNRVGHVDWRYSLVIADELHSFARNPHVHILVVRVQGLCVDVVDLDVNLLRLRHLREFWGGCPNLQVSIVNVRHLDGGEVVSEIFRANFCRPWPDNIIVFFPSPSSPVSCSQQPPLLLLREVGQVKCVVVFLSAQHSPVFANAGVIVVTRNWDDDFSGTEHVLLVWPTVRRAFQPCCELFHVMLAGIFEFDFLGFWSIALRVCVGFDEWVSLDICCEGQIKFVSNFLVELLLPLPDDKPKVAVRWVLENKVVNQQVVSKLEVTVLGSYGDPNGWAVCVVTHIFECRAWLCFEPRRNF